MWRPNSLIRVRRLLYLNSLAVFLVAIRRPSAATAHGQEPEEPSTEAESYSKPCRPQHLRPEASLNAICFEDVVERATKGREHDG
jgi:hypothetical protein